jgi:hypothetical protein
VGAAADGVPPIGLPISGVRCYVLDDLLDPVAPGVAGQLYIAGAGLARGYHAQPHVTASAFLPDPFGPAGARMYATGDRARWDEGTVFFLGRLDRQVKIRGIRIELAEVETVLAAVADAPAAVRIGRVGELVGYVTSAPADVYRLMAALRERLPAHLIPARLIAVAALPTTSNGKVDDAALDALDQPNALGDSDAAAPMLNVIEAKIATLWTALLGVGDFAASDDFFAQGGHSLLLAQLAARIALEFGIDVPLRVLFQEATLEAMAFEVLTRLVESLPASLAEQMFAAVDDQCDACVGTTN